MSAPRTTERPHGRTKYVLEKCRCETCRAGAREYERERKRRTVPAYIFFPGRGDTQTLKKAREVCARCPVNEECADFAAKTGADGIWGGLTEKQRRPRRAA